MDGLTVYLPITYIIFATNFSNGSSILHIGQYNSVSLSLMSYP